MSRWFWLIIVGLTWEDLGIINVGTDVHCDSHIQIEMCIENVPLKNSKRDWEFPWAGLFIVLLRFQNVSVLFHWELLYQASYVIVMFLPGVEQLYAWGWQVTWRSGIAWGRNSKWAKSLKTRTAQMGKEMPMLAVNIWKAVQEERRSCWVWKGSGQHFGKKTHLI